MCRTITQVTSTMPNINYLRLFRLFFVLGPLLQFRTSSAQIIFLAFIMLKITSPFFFMRPLLLNLKWRGNAIISVHCFLMYRIIVFRGVLVCLFVCLLGGASYRSPHVHI